MVSSVLDPVLSFVTAHWDWLVTLVVGWLSHQVLWAKVVSWFTPTPPAPPAAK